MTNETQFSAFRDLGRKAAERIASRLNAGNANSFGAQSAAPDIEKATQGMKPVEIYQAINHVQSRTQLSLYPLLELPEAEQARACAAYVAGCYEWAEQNPD